MAGEQRAGMAEPASRGGPAARDEPAPEEDAGGEEGRFYSSTHPHHLLLYSTSQETRPEADTRHLAQFKSVIQSFRSEIQIY